MTTRRKHPRVIVPDEYLTGVAAPLLLWADEAEHLADLGIVEGDALIFDQAVTVPVDGEVVAARSVEC